MKKLLVTLTPAESKRLIARGILATEEVRSALKNGYLCVTLGTTSAYIVEELIEGYDKTKHVAGVIVPNGTWVTKKEGRKTDAIFHKGKYIEGKKVVEMVDELGPGDVIVKSANAIDADYVPLVLLASNTGGSIGSVLGAVAAKNITLLMPVGLEKCIPSVYSEFAGQFGTRDWDYSIGLPVGVMAVPEGVVFSEIEALDALFSVSAIPIAAGGVNGAEGSVTLFIEGDDEEIERAHEFLEKEIKGEKPFPEIDILM